MIWNELPLHLKSYIHNRLISLYLKSKKHFIYTVQECVFEIDLVHYCRVYLVESVVVNWDIIQLRTLFDVLEMCFWSRESKLVFVHVRDMPQDVFTAALSDHLIRKRERRNVKPGYPIVLQAQVSEVNEAACRQANKCQHPETEQEPWIVRNTFIKPCGWLLKIW